MNVYHCSDSILISTIANVRLLDAGLTDLNHSLAQTFGANGVVDRPKKTSHLDSVRITLYSPVPAKICRKNLASSNTCHSSANSGIGHRVSLYLVCPQQRWPTRPCHSAGVFSARARCCYWQPSDRYSRRSAKTHHRECRYRTTGEFFRTCVLCRGSTGSGSCSC